MRARPGLWLLLLVPFLAGCDEPAPPPAKLSQAELDQQAAAFFAGLIRSFDLRIPDRLMESLEFDPRTSVPVTVRVDDRTFERVGVHVKGSRGSSRSIHDNPALTLNFDKFHDGQHCFGLEKLHLNNSVQDGTLMNENLASQLYLEAGVPTARAAHAHVRLNGRYLGLYVLKEGYDKHFIRRNFTGGTNPPGNLYDGGFVADIDTPLELDAGKGPTNRMDLAALVAALQAPAETRLAGLSNAVDLDRFLSFAVIQMLTDDWDGYIRKPNNYRLYIPQGGPAVFIPHGMDQLFENAYAPQRESWDRPETRFQSQRSQRRWRNQGGGLAAWQILGLPPLRDAYRERLFSYVSNHFTVPALLAKLEPVQARIRTAMAGRPASELENLDWEWRYYQRRLTERVKVVLEELANWPEPQPPTAAGTSVPLGEWEPRPMEGSPVLQLLAATATAPRSLHIRAAGGGAVASFRTALRPPPGRYRFAVRAMTRGVEPLSENPAHSLGEGAGIRISGERRSNHLVGDAGWTELAYEFDHPGDNPLELVVELRARRGEAWFDLDSAKLVVQ